MGLLQSFDYCKSRLQGFVRMAMLEPSPAIGCQPPMHDIRAVCRYDPYGRVLVIEEYDQEGMRAVRRRAVEAARLAGSFGLVLGTLGRQGNPRILEHIQGLLEKRGLPYTNVSGRPLEGVRGSSIFHIQGLTAA